MSIISLILLLAVAGFVCWLVLTVIPMPEPFPRVIVGVVLLLVVLYVLQALGVLPGHALRLH